MILSNGALLLAARSAKPRERGTPNRKQSREPDLTAVPLTRERETRRSQRGGAATKTECSRPRLQQRAAGGRLVNNPAHPGLRMLLRPETGALRPGLVQPATTGNFRVRVYECRFTIYDFGFESQILLTSLRTKGYDPAGVGCYEVTMILRESSVGLPANWTAAAVCSSGKRWEINCRTSSWREKTSRATSSCNVKSDE